MASTPVGDDPEKTAGLSFETSNHQHHNNANGQHHHPYARARERLRHFLHPDGKNIHVAASPEEAHTLRQQLSQIHQQHEFDVYISGTPEHLDALRRAQAHHEDRREELRTQHAAVYERFADVHGQLDALQNELDRVTSHGVSLEAHFSRFGYSAHIKSYDDESPSESGTATPRSSIHGEKKDSKAEEGFATRLKLFKVPVVRQYFHKGILWRGSDTEEVQSFELFIDLLYVGIIAINGDAAAEDPTGLALLQFVITFTLSWKIWNDMALIISWFETDDVFQRVSVLFLLACLFGYTTNITQAAEGEGTYPTLIGFYLCARLYMGSYLILVAILVPMIKHIMVWYAIVIVIGAALWIGSIHTPWPDSLALVWLALLVDICGQMAHMLLSMVVSPFSKDIAGKIMDFFEYFPAINIEHRTERMNAFVTLVFGYTVVALLYQSTVNGIDAHYGKAVLGLTQAFCYNWLYFEVDGANLHVHAIRRHKLSAFSWSMAHLPFIMSFVLGGGALARLVVAVDTPDSHLDALTEAYQERAEKDIKIGIRWFYCAGFGIALACMGFISLSHVHKDTPGLRFRKWKRLVFRFAVAIVIICLSLADSLDSLELVGIVTALVVIVLATELWASSCCSEKLFSRSKPCQYWGHCGKKDLEAMVRDGKEVDFGRLGSERTRKGGLGFVPT